jgi:hypothetical protein
MSGRRPVLFLSIGLLSPEKGQLKMRENDENDDAEVSANHHQSVSDVHSDIADEHDDLSECFKASGKELRGFHKRMASHHRKLARLHGDHAQFFRGKGDGTKKVSDGEFRKNLAEYLSS